MRWKIKNSKEKMLIIFYFWVSLKKWHMALPSHWKFQIKIDLLEDLAAQLKNFVTFKDRNVFTLYLEAP